MPLARVTRADLRGMCLDDLFVLLQWVVSELTERLTVRHEGDSVQMWVRGAPGSPRTPPAPAPEPEGHP